MKSVSKYVRIKQLENYVKCYRKASSQTHKAADADELKILKTAKRLELDEEVTTNLDSGLYHPRLHPGVVRNVATQLPTKLVEAMAVITEGRKKSELSADVKNLKSQLWGRQLPPERKDYIEHMQVEKKIVQATLKALPDKAYEDMRDTLQEKVVTRRLQDIIHPWHPLGVTAETCLQYLLARMPAEYCILHKIFSELRRRDPEFIPSTLFDFGSGVASGYWAVKEVWQQPLSEVYNVDSNPKMNALARNVLNIAGEKSSAEDGIYFRQFFPLSYKPTYDITLSAFSLLELPSFKERIEAVSRMWSKTEKYLVIVEDGTNAGYKAVMEARNLIIHLESTKAEGMINHGVHVVAPCPHEFVCPRFIEDHTPCNFKVHFLMPHFLQGKQVQMNHLYSYVVLMKGERPNNDHQWSRCVRETLQGKKEVHLRLCTSEGKLECVSLQKDYNCSNAYKCAKHTKWGDLLPGKIHDCEKSSTRKDR